MGGNAAVEDFDSFAARTCPGLLAKAMMVCRHRQDAEDAVQNSYLTAFRAWDRVRDQYQSPEAWLYTVLRNELCAQARKKAREYVEVEMVPMSRYPTPEQNAEAMAVLAALAGLPPKQRTAIVLHRLLGMPQAEIAEKLGVRRSTVAVNVRNARLTLEKVLGLVPERREGPQDGLVSARGLSSAWQISSTDPLDAALRATERWLREGLEDSPSAVERIRATVKSTLGPVSLDPEESMDRPEPSEGAA